MSARHASDPPGDRRRGRRRGDGDRLRHRRLPFAVAAAVLGSGCAPSDERLPAGEATEKAPPAEPTHEGVTGKLLEPSTREEAWQPLTREEIWRLGVERFGWYGEEPPPDTSKDELIRFFLIDEKYEDFVDDDPRYIEDQADGRD